MFTSAFLSQLKDFILDLLKIQKDAAMNKELGRSEASQETSDVIADVADAQAQNNAKVRTPQSVANDLLRP